MNSLTNIAIAIAKKHNAEIMFLHVIEVHEGEHLMAGLDETVRAKPMFEVAESLASASGVPARSIIEVSHRISQGIVQTAAMQNCNFILVRRQKQPTFLDRVFSSLIDTVLQKSPTEVAVLHGEFEGEKIRRILIPFGTGIHTRLATEIAPALADHFEAELRIVVVFDPDIPSHERDKRINEIQTIIQENSLSANLELVIEKDVLKGILERAKDADLVLMGGRTGDFLELLFAKSLSQEITEQVKCPVLWVKEYQEPRSFWTTFLKPYNRGTK